MVCVQKADMFDEPSSFLDVKQRLAAGRLIRSLLGPDSYVIVVEHDLSILDYLSDYICVLYGKPAVYGVVTAPFSVREGINIFLDGNVPTENLRFRDESLQFRIGDASEDFLVDKTQGFTYPAMEKTMGNFHLKVEPGTFTGSEILVMMGENGTGKTTFCKMLAGALKPDGDQKIPPMNISMKPQKITPKFQGTVRQLFFKRIKTAFINPQFQTDVYKPLKMDDFISVSPLCSPSACPPTSTSSTSRPPTSTLSSVSSPRASSSASSCTPRRPPSSSSTISSWPLTSPTASSSSTVSPPSTLARKRPSLCSPAATSSSRLLTLLSAATPAPTARVSTSSTVSRTRSRSTLEAT
jgi:ABC-type Mn2+/Zn2+ transport system ATPase subunit